MERRRRLRQPVVQSPLTMTKTPTRSLRPLPTPSSTSSCPPLPQRRPPPPPRPMKAPSSWKTSLPRPPGSTASTEKGSCSSKREKLTYFRIFALTEPGETHPPKAVDLSFATDRRTNILVHLKKTVNLPSPLTPHTCHRFIITRARVNFICKLETF